MPFADSVLQRGHGNQRPIQRDRSTDLYEVFLFVIPLFFAILLFDILVCDEACLKEGKVFAGAYYTPSVANLPVLEHPDSFLACLSHVIKVIGVYVAEIIWCFIVLVRAVGCQLQHILYAMQQIPHFLFCTLFPTAIDPDCYAFSRGFQRIEETVTQWPTVRGIVCYYGGECPSNKRE